MVIQSTVRCMSLCRNILVSGSRDTTLRAWNIETGMCEQYLTGHVAAVRCVQFDLDDGRIVSGAYDFTVKVWDFETGICIYTLTGHTNRVYSLLLDARRNIVVSGSLDTTIRVWDISKGTCISVLSGHHSLTSGMQLRGDILVSCNADSDVRVWNIRDGSCMYRLHGPNGHTSAITSLQFLDNGIVVTSGDDGAVKLWDVIKAFHFWTLQPVSHRKSITLFSLSAQNECLTHGFYKMRRSFLQTINSHNFL
ncbi:F-box/WD repeat-containing protein 7 [Parelaphostrongylus tenuis]|uniref:F-box/WD repeat-containing protein 7 n=1 Tax=Parelaphostrongylus tenuis TaxID=148309 RepID=A0AAD5MRG4_PARTN|nr:F-box/WD repeat-containing protein 7 [Parelaphostrongylus tenuis]